MINTEKQQGLHNTGPKLEADRTEKQSRSGGKTKRRNKLRSGTSAGFASRRKGSQEWSGHTRLATYLVVADNWLPQASRDLATLGVLHVTIMHWARQFVSNRAQLP